MDSSSRDLSHSTGTALDGGVREGVALNCMRWRMDCGGDWPMDKVRGTLRCIAEEHSGDCTKQPWTCMRCEAEAAYKQADEILGLLPSRTPQVAGARSREDQ